MPFYTDPVTKQEHKFACSHCIRGHRSTNCSHSDRPLFYIRKKGRPVSQCTQCRALRKNRSLHTRCDCPNRVQNKGLTNGTEYADLPQGMTTEAAKAFLEGLSMDHGGCRNCNSNRCQCDARATPSIAPASAASSPATPLSSDFSSAYPIPYSPSFSSNGPIHGRSAVYSLPTSHYATVPQFTGIPAFNVFAPNPPNPLSTSTPAQMSAQIQHFQRRQEYLMASAQRNIQQDYEMKKRGRGSGVLSCSASSTAQFPEIYRHRASLPANFESSLHHDTVAGASGQQVAPYTQLRPADVSIYSYVNDLSQTLPYAASLSATLFRHPAIVEIQPRRQSLSPSANESDEKALDVADNPDPTSSPDSSKESNNSSRTSLPLHTTGTENSASETGRSDEYSKQEDADVDDEPASKKEQHVQPMEGSIADGYPSLEKMFESWDAADTEWLYSLQTECAKRGVVCECGDSCCCPGCFTHTNNPGDRGVYQAMLTKLGAILETEAEQNEASYVGKPCLSTAPKQLGTSSQPT